MTSSLPKLSTAVATRFLISSSFETSHLTAIALGASGTWFLMMSTARLAASTLMSATTTWAPSPAKTRADSRPIPLFVCAYAQRRRGCVVSGFKWGGKAREEETAGQRDGQGCEGAERTYDAPPVMMATFLSRRRVAGIAIGEWSRVSLLPYLYLVRVKSQFSHTHIRGARPRAPDRRSGLSTAL